MDAPAQGRLRRWIHRAWWLHSFGALGFGVFVMLMARRGLGHADKLLLVLLAAWLLVFVALRFFPGGPPGAAGDDERGSEPVARRGLRLVTNYLIKNLYQQMFFFLVPFYVASATWTWDSPNIYLPIVLAVCAVLSCLDTFFDGVVMTRRWLAASLFGVCLFGVLNLVLPIVLAIPHARALTVAAVAAPAATALLSFRVRAVFSVGGLFWVVAATTVAAAGAWKGRVAVPPAPLAMAYGAIGHGTPGEYEVLPGRITRLRADQLGGLRCATLLVEPGPPRDEIVHVWRHRGQVIARLAPDALPTDEPHARALRSSLTALPADPLGPWRCVVETREGQLVGVVAFDVIPATSTDPATKLPPPSPSEPR